MLKSLNRAALLVLGCCAPALAQVPWITEQQSPVGQENPSWLDTRASTTWWDNGTCDDVNALQSQYNPATGKYQCVADDYVLKAGLYYYYDTISFEFYVNKGHPDPQWVLDLYKDCNGKPQTLVDTYGEFEKTLIGPSQKFTNFDIWSVKFININRYEAGHESDCTTAKRYWLSPKGLGAGLYYWRTANEGKIQGAVSMYKNNFGTQPDWIETYQGCCPGPCTDFCFVINGLVCCLLHDNSDYELTGLGSLQSNIIDFGTRAVDNFQVPPGGCCVDICRIEAWIAHNCTEIFGEIYGNECDCPGPEDANCKVAPLYTLVDPVVTATGETTTDGIPVYHVLWHEPGICLDPGCNYWFSVVAQGNGKIDEVAYFLFKDSTLPCPILISEGKYQNCWIGPECFTKVSDPEVFGIARDFAFRVYIKAPSCVAGSSAGAGCISDINADGFINGDDFDVFVAAFEAGC